MYYIESCEGKGQTFKSYGWSCTQTCHNSLLQHPCVGLSYCKPGCECPTGQINLELSVGDYIVQYNKYWVRIPDTNKSLLSCYHNRNNSKAF